MGYSYQAQKHHVDAGNWLRIDRGMFRLPEWPATAEDAYVRWGLWSKGRGVLSHDSALAVHRLSDVNPQRVHLTVGSDFHARDDAVLLHVADLTEDEVESRGAWSVTTVERTVLDVAGDLSQDQLDEIVRDALEDGRLTRRRVLGMIDRADDRAALRLERAINAAEPS